MVLQFQNNFGKVCLYFILISAQQAFWTLLRS